VTRILVVDDDLSMREFLELMLGREGYDILVAEGGEEALEIVAKAYVDLVITDIKMKGLDGIDVLRGVKSLHPDTVVILISAFATAETAVKAMKEGAYDFIPKPFRIDELKAVVKNALDHRTPEAERRVLAEKVKDGCHFGSLVGLSPVMLKVYDLVRRSAQTSTNVLITGESGTGKELVAKAIHDNSPRADENFVAINCGGMPEQLVESELFGYKKGAFTGAAADKHGLFELADKGTLFLDELAELSLPMQVKLLRAVQEKTFRPIGATREKQADVRIIAATNKDLETELMAGRFREDLYYRLNVINIHMPPLRDRQGDIPLLAQYFLEKYSRDMGKDVRKVSAYALDILSNYIFPGNVRELENIIERSVALEQSNIILPESLTLASFKHKRRIGEPIEPPVFPARPSTPPPDSQDPAEPNPDMPGPETKADHQNLSPPLDQHLDDILATLEKYLLLKAMIATSGIRQKTADLLSISTWKLRSRIKQHGLAHLNDADLEAAFIQCEKNVHPEFLPDWTPNGINLDVHLLKTERGLIDQAIRRVNGNKTEAAAMLGISQRTIHSRLARCRDAVSDK
jgi:two-component system, NtrC family, response regulator PilR